MIEQSVALDVAIRDLLQMRDDLRSGIPSEEVRESLL
jgi:hypothetical protein